MEAGGDHAVLRVRDTGLGIAAAMLPRVFDLFTQVSGQENRSEGGLGIGLSVVRSLSNGTAAAFKPTDAGRDKAAEFVVCLPLFRREGNPAGRRRDDSPQCDRRGPRPSHPGH